MSDELKPCPFCGKPFEIVSTPMGLFTAKHGEDCPMWNDAQNCMGYSDVETLIEVLNARPIEDTLRARVAELERERNWLRDMLDSIGKILNFPIDWEKSKPPPEEKEEG